jgi:hypothetical protein
MNERPRRETDDLGTMELIAAARRPILIERHRGLVEEMESGLSDALLAGDPANPRLKAMLAELDTPLARKRLSNTVTALAEDFHYRQHTVRQALVEEMCLLREQQQVEIAALQIHAIGVYRELRRLLAERQGEPPEVGDLRELPASAVGRLTATERPGFGSPRLADAAVYTPAFGKRCLRTIKRLRRADSADTLWEDAGGPPPLPRDLEEPLASLPEAERTAARTALVRDRIRSHFFREVFLVYMSADEFDPKEAEAHPTVLHWLEAIEATPHLFPFLQGQSSGQKSFRIAQLMQKLIQMHEMYARVALASQHPTYRESFEGIGTRERLKVLAKDRYPPLVLSPELALAALICPFGGLVTWVQERVASNDFVLPPDARR